MSYLAYASLIDKTVLPVFYATHRSLMIDFLGYEDIFQGMGSSRVTLVFICTCRLAGSDDHLSENPL